jgi:polysaccharide export outer membrane protein
MIDEEVFAACKTERELSEQIKERYKKYLLNPHVIVAIQEFNSSPVAVIGAVSSPGRFQLRRPTRVLELFTFVNGISDKAGSNVNLIRNRSLPYCEGSDLVVSEGVGDELISINLSDTLKGVEEANPYVRAGDILMVSEATLARAYVMGSVRNPSIISLSEPVTLTQAIAMSGGFASGAQSDKVVIRRQIEGSANRSEMIVSVKEVNQRKTDDVLLRPNDIVEVAGPGKFSTFLRTLVPTLTQLPLRVVP